MVTFPFLLYFLFVLASCSSDRRKEELSRIKHYELLHFNLDHFASDHQIEFDLFNQHYKIQLFANDNMIPSRVNPTIGHPQSDTSSKWFSSRTESCHYFGYIAEPETHRSDISYRNVALSLCPKRGIRGSILLNGEKIWIKPAAYYLDEEHNRSKYHQLSDSHLVYKSSDNNRSDALIPRAMRDSDHTHSLSHSQSSSSASRKLLASKTCELYVLADYAQVEEFKDDHDDDWYQELLSMALDYINNVDADYTNLGKVGDIDIKLVRFEVVESWSGDYRELRPSDYSSSEVDCLTYKTDFKEWLEDTDRDNYDVHQIWTDYQCERASGWGSVGCVCDSSRCSSLVATISRNGDEGDINTVAHEMGHNFGAHHDDDAGCPEEDGIMGDLRHGWSDCSIDAFEEHYDDTDSLSCLRNGPKSFSTNYGGDYDGGNDDQNNNNDDDEGGDDGDSGDGTQIFYDRMADLNAWSVSSSTSVSISTDSSKCSSSSCVRIKGYDGRDNSITRSVSNDYSSYALKFDVILDNMETNNACEVEVKFDSRNWNTIKSFKGDCCTSTEEFKSQTAEFNAASASTLYLRLSTDGDSSSGGDRCFFDNVYLYGSGSGSRSGRRFELDPCLRSNPYGDRLCLYKGKEEYVYELSADDGCMNDHAVYKYIAYNDSDASYLHFNKFDAWVVSMAEIKIFGSLVCDESDLLNCISGKWKAWTSNGEDADELIVDQDIWMEACPLTVSKDGGMESDMKMWLVIIAIVVYGLLMIGCYVICKKKKRFKGELVEDEEFEESIEVEMEIDTQPDTKL